MATLNELFGHYKALDGIRLNMVIDGNGLTAGSDGSSKSISSAADRALLVHLRSISGLIITDAATAATERYKPSKFAPIEIWSKTSNFRGLEATAAEGTHHAVDLVHTPELPEAISRAHQRSPYLLLESGRTLSTAIATLGLIDELCLTVGGVSADDTEEEKALAFAETIHLGDLKIAKKTRVHESTFFVMRR